MNRILIVVAGVGIMTACTGSEDLVDPGQAQDSKAIRVATTFVGKNYTRDGEGPAATGDIENLAALNKYQIKLWGDMMTPNTTSGENVIESTSIEENIFEGTTFQCGTTQVSGKEGAYYWEQVDEGDDKYWNTDGNVYHFAAVAPADASVTYSPATNTGEGAELIENNVTTRKFSITDIPLTQEISNENGALSGVDYLVSDNQKATFSDNCVNLSFKHILSRLHVYVFTNVEGNTKVRLDDLKLYLPKSELSATYAEASHDGPAVTDVWEWDNSFEAPNSVEEGKSLTTDYKYDAHPMMESLSNYDNIQNDTNNDGFLYSFAAAEMDYNDLKEHAKKMEKEFFLAPTPSEMEMKVYVDLKYSVWNPEVENSTTYIASENPENSEKYFEKKNVLIRAFKSFAQGYHTNLFICITHDTSSIQFSADITPYDDEWLSVDQDGKEKTIEEDSGE